MKNIIIYLILTSFFTMSCVNKNEITYPLSKKVDTVDIYFGTEISDPYRWLENPNSHETKLWIDKQNEITFNYLSNISYREKIKKRLTEIYNYPKMSAPVKKSGKYFFVKNDGLQNQNILYFQDSLRNVPKVLVDPNILDKQGTIALGEFDISSDGKYIAYSVSTGGSDWREISVKNIKNGTILPDKLSRVKFSDISWYKDGIFYSSYPEVSENIALNNQKVYYHKLNTNQSEDKLIYENPYSKEAMFSAKVTDDEKYLIVHESETTYGNKVYVKDLSAFSDTFIEIEGSFDYENIVIGNKGNKLYMLTNNGSPFFKIQVIEIKNDGTLNKEDLIYGEKARIDLASLAGDVIVVKYLVDAHSDVKVYDFSGKFLYNIELPKLGDLSAFNGELNENEAFYSFDTYTSPTLIYRYNVSSNSSELIFKPTVNYNPEDFTTELKFYKSKDGTNIPLYLTYKKGIELNGKNPTLLYGYGGFNISLTPRFIPYVIFWMENGGVFANANLRGGGEYGEKWHKAGTKLKKQNVFDDFIAAANYLIDSDYTSPDYLVIEGRSNGGLLVGAVTNQRPDLFRVSLPAVGVMDMLRFGVFTIGRAWESDYGSVKNPEEFENLLSISPLHNIRNDINYPAVLVTTAKKDDRVVPAHSFKYIATLQEKYNGDNPVLIRIQTEAGHGAGKPMTVLIDERVDIMAFTFYNLKINPF